MVDTLWLTRGVCIVAVLFALFAAIAVDLRVNPVGRTRQYQLARLRNWLAAGLVYMIFYQARYAATISNTDDMRERMGVSTAQYGTILTAGFWSYAAWTMINGHWLDAIGGRKGLLVGSIGCAMSCLCMGLVAMQEAPSLAAMVLLNVVNLGFNSLAALSVLRINVNWYGKAERGVFSGVFGVMISLGYYLALTVGSWAEADLPRGFAFFLPSALLLLVGVPLCMSVVQNTPILEEEPLSLREPKPTVDAALAYPSHNTQARQEQANAESMRPVFSGQLASTGGASAEAPPRARFREAALEVVSHARVRAAMLALLGVGWAREGFLSWFGSYLEELSGIEQAQPQLRAARTEQARAQNPAPRLAEPHHFCDAQGSTQYTLMTTAMSLCSIAGSLGGGYVSDRYCGSKRGPVLVVYGAAQLVRQHVDSGSLGWRLGAERPCGRPPSLHDSPSQVCLGLLHLAEGHARASLVLVPLLSAFLFGALTLLMGAASADFVPPQLAGMASGLLNAGQYSGSGLSSLLIGWIVDATGTWRVFTPAVALGPLVCTGAMAWLMWLQRAAAVIPAVHAEQVSAPRVSDVVELVSTSTKSKNVVADTAQQ